MFQASLSFQALPTGAQGHKMSQSACFAHVVQYVHAGTVDSVCARNGSGQIQLMSTGRYRVRISAGNDPVTGKRRQPSKVVHGTRQDAERARAELLLRSGRNRDRESEIILQDLVSQHLGQATLALTLGPRLRPKFFHTGN